MGGGRWLGAKLHSSLLSRNTSKGAPAMMDTAYYIVRVRGLTFSFEGHSVGILLMQLHFLVRYYMPGSAVIMPGNDFTSILIPLV